MKAGRRGGNGHRRPLVVRSSFSRSRREPAHRRRCIVPTFSPSPLSMTRTRAHLRLAQKSRRTTRAIPQPINWHLAQDHPVIIDPDACAPAVSLRPVALLFATSGCAHERASRSPGAHELRTKTISPCPFGCAMSTSARNRSCLRASAEFTRTARARRASQELQDARVLVAATDGAWRRNSSHSHRCGQPGAADELRWIDHRVRRQGTHLR